VRTILQKFRLFWTTFWESIKKAYSKATENPLSSATQIWRDIRKINFLDIFVTKLNNLANTEATFEVESDSVLTERLKALCKDLENKRFLITENMLGDGDYYIFPAHNSKGEIVHTYLTQEQVRIVDIDGEEIKEAYGIIDWCSNNNQVYFLLRHHKLDDNGTLTISYSSVTENGKKAFVEKWEYLKESSYSWTGANHIGFGRYKSQKSSRGLSPVYGVPLNFGCTEIEKRIFEDLKLMQEEFENGKSVVFTDPRNLLTNEEKKQYEIASNIIPVDKRAAQNGNFIEIFNPTLRQSEHYSKLVCDMALLEKEIGTSKGILTDNETSYTATATAVKRANADTLSLIDRIHTAIDGGNEMTLLADCVFLNISPDLWSYKSDYFDPFEDPDTQWQRLVEAKNNGAAEREDLIKWQWPTLTDDEIKEKKERIIAEEKNNSNKSIESMLNM
jgi:hypothetical protein